MAVALLAYLRYLQQHIAAAQQRAHGQRPEVEALDHKIFSEGTGNDVCPTFIEGLYLVGTQKTHLSVPAPGVRVAVNAPFGGEVRGIYIVLLQTLTVARTYGYDLSYAVILLSDSLRAAR